MKDIVVTGIGVISSIGVGREAFWKNLGKAKSGIKRVTLFETDSFCSNIAAWVDGFDPERFMSAQTFRRMSRVSRMAVAASIEAIEDSGLDMAGLDRSRIGIVLGTSYGASSFVDDFFVGLLKDGSRGAHPFLFPETVPNAPASQVAMFHGITGPNTTFSQNEISAEVGIVYARSLLLHDQADVVIVVGADELSAIQFSCYHSLGALNPVRIHENETPTPRPNGGLILGEGAGALVMENSDFACRRRARVYGTLRSAVLSGGSACTGHYEAEGKHAARAILTAIHEAGLNHDNIDHVDVSANFSWELDRIEYGMLQTVFQHRVSDLAITPLKYLIGDFGGAGVTRAAAILLGLHNQIPLPRIKAQELLGEARVALDWDTGQNSRFENALMTTTTFGGGSASMIWTRHQDFRPQ